MSHAARKRISYAEYQALELEAEGKHEFESGVLTAMGGGSPHHALISANLVGELRQQLKRSDCGTYSSDHKIWVGAHDAAFYPDATVVCGGPVHPLHDALATVNPSLVGEVLSPSTRGRDATTKLAAYQTLRTLRHVLLVDSEEVFVMHYARQADGGWRVTSYRSLEDIVTLDLHDGVVLALHELYARVVFPEPEPEPEPEA